MRDTKGAMEYFRRGFGFLLLAVFALIPWLTYQGEQAVLLDIMDQRFRIYGLTLWPQDFTVVAWFAIVAAVALFFVTTVFGRVWCGFMCPQTTWTFIFMWFEKKFEGPRNKRIKLDERKMDFDKFWRKTGKQTGWILVSLLTAMTFVGYFTDIRELFLNFFTLDAGFWATFSVLFSHSVLMVTPVICGKLCVRTCVLMRVSSRLCSIKTLTPCLMMLKGRAPRPTLA